MRRFDEISRQVMTLSSDDRLLLVDWIMERTEGPIGVAEAAPDYALLADRSRKLTLEEYLAFEASSPLSHEFVAGEIYAMCEPNRSHELVVTNLVSDIRGHLRGRPCRTYAGKTKVQFKCRDDDIVYRPDVWVACGEARDSDGEFMDEPRLVIEVLSRSTERIDRREKAVNYREIPTLEEIVLVAQSAANIVLYRRSDQWCPVVLRSLQQALELKSIGLTLPLERIYEGLP